MSSNNCSNILRTPSSEYITDNLAITNEFNNYFTSVFQPAYTVSSVIVYNNTNLSQPINFSPTVVYKAMLCIKKTLSVGPDHIPLIFWAKLASALYFPVSILFNCSYNYCLLPNEWRNATEVPLLKKGDPNCSANYKPISLTCTICKIIESVIRDNIIEHAKYYHLINSNQYGFLSNRSTATQLLECLYDWNVTLDTGQKTDVIHIDFKKAFDSVPHDLLINNCLTTVIASKQLTAFLLQKCNMSVSNAFSLPSDVTSGIVQGSVLDPALFVIYIDYLPDVCNECKV